MSTKHVTATRILFINYYEQNNNHEYAANKGKRTNALKKNTMWDVVRPTTDKMQQFYAHNLVKSRTRSTEHKREW